MTDIVKRLRDDASITSEFVMTQADFVEAADEIERNRAAIGELVAALRGGVVLASNAHVYWDSDQDAKVGKHLLALCGVLKGYDAKADAIHAAIAKHEPKP